MASSSSPSPRGQTWQASDFFQSLLHHFPLSGMKSCQLSSFNVSSITPSSVFTMTPSCSGPCCLLYILMTQLCNCLPIDSVTPTSLSFKVTRLIWFIVSHAKTSIAFDFRLRKFKITAWHAKPFSVSWTFNPSFNSYYFPSWSLSSSHICMPRSRAVNGSLPRCQEIKGDSCLDPGWKAHETIFGSEIKVTKSTSCICHCQNDGEGVEEGGLSLLLVFSIGVKLI